MSCVEFENFKFSICELIANVLKNKGMSILMTFWTSSCSIFRLIH